MKKSILTLVLFLGVAIFAMAEKQTVTLHIPGMHCGDCLAKIEKVLSYEKGVRKLESNIQSKSVTIIFNDEKTDVTKIQAALVKYLKYESKVVVPKVCSSACSTSCGS